MNKKNLYLLSATFPDYLKIAINHMWDNYDEDSHFIEGDSQASCIAGAYQDMNFGDEEYPASTEAAIKRIATAI